jgi:hypothetical protein
MLVKVRLCCRQVWLCGEVVTMILRDRFTQLFPHVQLLNLYSISECHDVACSGKFSGTRSLTDLESDSVPLGYLCIT